jgi:hypothetical protein
MNASLLANAFGMYNNDRCTYQELITQLKEIGPLR